MSRRTPETDDLDLLLEVWEAERVLDYPRIRSLLAPVPLEKLLASDEYIILLFHAYDRLGDSAQAAALRQAAAPVFADTRNDRNRIRFLNASAAHAQRIGRLSEAELLAHEVLEYAHRAGDDEFALDGIVMLGVTSGVRGNYVESLRHLNRALAINLAGDAIRWIPAVHHNLGIAYRELGFFAEAERHFEQACRYVRPEWMRAITDLDRAILRLVVGDPSAAWELARHALAITERIRSSAVVAETRSVLGRIAATEGHHAKAREELETALSLVPPGHVLLLAQIYEEFAALAVLCGDADARSEAEMAAGRYYREIEAIPRLERMALRLEMLSEGASPTAS